MLTLTFGTETITLRSPDFGNTDSRELRRISRKTRGLDMIVYRDPVWPKTNIQTYNFSYIKRDELMKLIGFLDRSLGKNVTLVDYMEHEWTGVIITPSTAIAEAARNNFTVQLQFQGVRT